MFPSSPVDWGSMPSSSSLKVGTPPVPEWVWQGYAVGPGNPEVEVSQSVNAQMKSQQSLNASGVTSSYVDLAGGGLYQAGTAVGELPWMWIGLGVGVLAFLLVRR